jgi:Na+/proline symporter
MAKRAIFISVWMAVGFFVAAIIALSITPFVPKPGTTEEQISAAMAFVYVCIALLPWVGIGIPLILGLLGRLPGTKRDVSN